MATILEETPTRHGPAPARPRSDGSGDGVPRPLSVLAALLAGVAAATVLLAAALHGEFPLFSEASAERGRDCATIASARHALDASLQSRIPLRPGDAESARAIRSAVAAFEARTQDIATASVRAGLSDVRRDAGVLVDRVQADSAAGSSDEAATGVDEALAAVRRAWAGPIGRVCS